MKRVIRFAWILATLFAVVLAIASVPTWDSAVYQDTVEAAPSAPIRFANTILPPWHYRDKDGTQTGFLVDMMQDIGRRLGRPVEIIEVQFAGIFPGLFGGKYDVIAAAISQTCERQKFVDFGVPYYDQGLSITVRKDDPRVQREEDLRGLVAGAEGAGTLGHLWLRDHKDALGIKDIRVYEDLASSMLDLQAGRVDAVVQNLPTAAYYIRDKANLEVRVHTLKGVERKSAFAFPKGTLALRPRVDEAINAMKRDGTMARINQKFFGFVPSPNAVVVNVMPREDTCK